MEKAGGKVSLLGGDMEHRGSEAGTGSVCWRDRQKASVAGIVSEEENGDCSIICCCIINQFWNGSPVAGNYFSEFHELTELSEAVLLRFPFSF